MSKRNKMLTGMMIGAVIGAAVSLFDKETREQTIKNGKRLGLKAKEVCKHPEVVTNAVKEKVHVLTTTIEQVSEDIRFLSEKVDELNETAPEMINIIKDTKQVFSRKQHQIEED